MYAKRQKMIDKSTCLMYYDDKDVHGHTFTCLIMKFHTFVGLSVLLMGDMVVNIKEDY